MACGRLIMASQCTDRRFTAVAAVKGHVVELAYLHARLLADRDGRVTGEPTTLRALACPTVYGMTDALMADCMADWCELGVAEVYEAAGQRVCRFTEHALPEGQHKKEGRSSFPPPAGAATVTPAQLRRDSGATPADIRSNAGATPVGQGFGSGLAGQGVGGFGTAPPPAPSKAEKAPKEPPRPACPAEATTSTPPKKGRGYDLTPEEWAEATREEDMGAEKAATMGIVAELHRVAVTSWFRMPFGCGAGKNADPMPWLAGEVKARKFDAEAQRKVAVYYNGRASNEWGAHGNPEPDRKTWGTMLCNCMSTQAEKAARDAKFARAIRPLAHGEEETDTFRMYPDGRIIPPGHHTPWGSPTGKTYTHEELDRMRPDMEAAWLKRHARPEIRS